MKLRERLNDEEVHRHAGGLEILFLDRQKLLCVHRHAGGLETRPSFL